MKHALVIGGNGFLGYGAVKALTEKEWDVRSFDRTLPDKSNTLKIVEYIAGDLRCESDFKRALRDIDTVFYFMSNSIPRNNEPYLINEIHSTLETLDYVLREMVEAGVKQFVFPSSGGAVYGNVSDAQANEKTETNPTTTYGMGKLLSEQMIGFYCRKHEMHSIILRIGNVYGSPFLRKQQQGAIDVFIQKALEKEPISIWGNAIVTVRDYIYLDDVSSAVATVASTIGDGIQIYNVGTGRGVALQDVVKAIESALNQPLDIEVTEDSISDVNRIILDCKKIQEQTGWHPKYSLEEGIKATIAAKELLFTNL